MPRRCARKRHDCTSLGAACAGSPDTSGSCIRPWPTGSALTRMPSRLPHRTLMPSPQPRAMSCSPSSGLKTRRLHRHGGRPGHALHPRLACRLGADPGRAAGGGGAAPAGRPVLLRCLPALGAAGLLSWPPRGRSRHEPDLQRRGRHRRTAARPRPAAAQEPLFLPLPRRVAPGRQVVRLGLEPSSTPQARLSPLHLPRYGIRVPTTLATPARDLSGGPCDAMLPGFPGILMGEFAVGATRDRGIDNPRGDV